MFCLDWVPSLTIGLETGFQNFALALIMLEVSVYSNLDFFQKICSPCF